MKPIVDASTMALWLSFSGDNADKPFEESLGATFGSFFFADYSVIFHSEAIEAACAWSAENDLAPFAMFFSIPEPVDYFIERGVYGGVVATGEDKPSAIVSFLTDDNRWAGHLSIYDASHRFIVVPSGRDWMIAGDRDADLAIFGFKTSSQQESFMKALGKLAFDSIEDAAAHAKSFMRYELDVSLFSQRMGFEI